MRKKEQATSGEMEAVRALAKVVHDAEQQDVSDNLMATERVADDVRRRQSKRGSLGLPKLLDERRIKYAIPDGAFEEQAVFDRIFVFQVRPHVRQTFSEGGKVLLTQVGKQREQESSPFGIVISAGLPALDNLRANGIELGHLVGFIREAPWRKPVDVIGGVEFYVCLLRTGDITGSVDLANSFKNGDCKIHIREIKNDDGIVTREHVYCDKSGKLWDPSQPFIPADK
jgi:hypothetical protein